MIDKQKKYKRQNEWNKENYKRISFVLDLDTWQKVQQILEGRTVSGYVKQLILQDLEKNKTE